MLDIIRKLEKITDKYGYKEYPVILRSRNLLGKPRGVVLISYLEFPIKKANWSRHFLGHSNAWESREIAKLFQEFGYQVDAISFLDKSFTPKKKYDVVFDIFGNIGRLSKIWDEKPLMLLHCTGSDPVYQNNAEINRVRNLNNRRAANYCPKRLISCPSENYLSMDIANAISLIGNEWTKMTYPEKYRNKIELVSVSTNFENLSIRTKNKVPIEKEKKEFLWFFGDGAVHKGLDLVLEVFARNPKFILNIIGNIQNEKDFLEIYSEELNNKENIILHGHLNLFEPKSLEILSRVFCFIAPSCSEGISPATALCLQLGLFPIISRDTGITLPADCGFYLESCTIEEIEYFVNKASSTNKKIIEDQSKMIQDYAIQKYSRETFSNSMRDYLSSKI